MFGVCLPVSVINCGGEVKPQHLQCAPTCSSSVYSLFKNFGLEMGLKGVKIRIFSEYLFAQAELELVNRAKVNTSSTV